ncbi:hypothetical protein TDB9533_02295 [Thalassocella blandensis]|nr:hypothetical protein TDB9533_02295 [Thalassocella blandensis]
MTFRIANPLWIFVCFVLIQPLNALAFDCSRLQEYSAGEQYTVGTVIESEGQAFECKVGGWCSLGGAYTPGIGWAQADAWNMVGSCVYETTTSAEAPVAAAANNFPITKQQFNQLFPNRLPFYSYDSFRQAAQSFPKFAKVGSAVGRKREVAAALANFQHETGNFRYKREIHRGEYCGNWGAAGCDCKPGRKYFGRGPIQLSWNGNYCAAGRALGVNLLANPDLLAHKPVLAWKSAIWFWMTQSGAGNMSAHAAMVNGRGFGETIRTINGSIECNGGNPGQVTSRVQNYKRILKKLGVKPGNNLRC